MDVREIVIVVARRDVQSRFDDFAPFEGIELGLGLDRIIHRHRLHESRNRGRVYAGGLILRIYADDFSDERVAMGNHKVLLFFCTRKRRQKGKNGNDSKSHFSRLSGRARIGGWTAVCSTIFRVAQLGSRICRSIAVSFSSTAPMRTAIVELETHKSPAFTTPNGFAETCETHLLLRPYEARLTVAGRDFQITNQ